jgi:hypothetical protein
MRASCARCGAEAPARPAQGVHTALPYVCTKCQNAADSIPVQLSNTPATAASPKRTKNMQLDFDDSKAARDARANDDPKPEPAGAAPTAPAATAKKAAAPASQSTRAAAADAAKRLAAAAASTKAAPATARRASLDDAPRPDGTRAELREPDAPISMSDLPTIADEDTMAPSSSELEIVDPPTVESDAVQAIARTIRAEEEGDEPVSIKELEMILAPGKAPPRIAKAAASAPPRPPPRKRTPQRAASDDLGSTDLAAMATHAPASPKAPAVTARPRGKPRVPSPRDSSAHDIELMGRLSAAPAARRSEPAPADEAVEPAPDSRMNDILGMAAGYKGDRRSAPTPAAKIDVAPDSGDVLALRGGLFDGSLLPIVSSDLALPTAPTESLAPLMSPTDPPPRSRARAGRAAAQTASTTPRASAPPNRRTGLWIGAFAVAAAALVALNRNPAPKEEASAPSAPERAPAAAAPPRAPARPMAEEPSIDDTPTPATPPESTPASHAPRDTPAPQTSPAVAAQPASPAAAQPKPAAPTAAAPPPSGAEFDATAASSALSRATGEASACRAPGDPSGTASVRVTFAPSGRVTSAVLSGPPYAGTQTGGCIARTLRNAVVPAFSGVPVQVTRTITIR